MKSAAKSRDHGVSVLSLADRHIDPQLPYRWYDMNGAGDEWLGDLGPKWEVHRVHSPGSSYAVISCMGILPLMPDLKQLADTVQERLLPGGLFIFLVPVYDGVLGMASKVAKLHPEHVHKWSRALWVAWANYQFEVVHSEVIAHGVGRNLLVVARKLKA